MEYTTDGGSTWQPATPTDGAFDSHAEDFTVDLNLPDFVYGILVRETGADGTQLPVADWAGTRFTIDSVAPAPVADLAAPVITEADSPVAYARWSPSEPPSDTTSAVRYVVALDDTEVGSTYDTQLDVPLADTGPHILTVTPVDEAGNTGSTSTVEAAPDTIAPTTAVTGADTDWHDTAVTVSFTPSDNAGGSGMSAGAAKTEYKLDSGDWTSGTSCIVPAPSDHSGDGVHTVSYRSTDRAGNTEVAKSVHVNIDTTLPATTDNAGSAWHAGPWSLTLTPTDPLAPDGSHAGMSGGAADTQYSLDNGASWHSGTSVAFPRWKRGGGSGSYDVLYRSTDAAGNTEQTESTTVRIDNSLPTSDAALTVAADPATVTLTATDPDSGVACLWYSLDGGAWQRAVYPGPAGVPVTIAGLGTHTLCYYAVDVAGNPQAGYRVATVTNTAAGSTLRPAVARHHRVPRIRRAHRVPAVKRK